MRKLYFTICNYNAQRQNQSLEKSLTALQKIKNENVVVSMFDNMSKDDSIDVIQRFYDNGVIDHAILSRQNYGKAFAMNRLYEYLEKAYKIEDDDIIVNMDSDIIINYPNFVVNASIAFYVKEVGCIGYNFWEDDQMTIRNKYQNRQVCSNTININGVQYGRIASGQGLAGGVLCIRNNLFKKFKYNEHLGNKGTPAIYGGDDAVLTLQLFNSGFVMLFDQDSPIVHYPAIDSDYQKWKERTNNNMCRNGFGNSTLPTKGFYD